MERTLASKWCFIDKHGYRDNFEKNDKVGILWFIQLWKSENLSFFKHLAFRSAIQIAWYNGVKFFSKSNSFFRGVARGGSGPPHPRNLADKLTRYKWGGQIMPLKLLPALLDSKSYLHLCFFICISVFSWYVS